MHISTKQVTLVTIPRSSLSEIKQTTHLEETWHSTSNPSSPAFGKDNNLVTISVCELVSYPPSSSGT